MDNDCRNDEDEEDDCGDDESDYEYTYEEEDDSHFTGFLQQPPKEAAWARPNATNATATMNNASNDSSYDMNSSAAKMVPCESDNNNENNEIKIVKKWKEPSRAAVNMSLRAERETTGGKRRLAQDLYKIMMGDTSEQGFRLEPADEDSMEKWKIVLFGFDEDSNLAKDLKTIGMDGVELEMSFPEQYPFQPPFVRVTRPKFKRQTGFVMNGALCMELLTSDGWNPINDIESVIVSIRSLLVVGDGRLEAAVSMPSKERELLLEAAKNGKKAPVEEFASLGAKRKGEETANDGKENRSKSSGEYSMAEAKAAHSHLSKYHKQEGWSAHWARKG